MKEYLHYLKWVLMIIGATRFRIFGAFVGFFLGLYIENLLLRGRGSFIYEEDSYSANIQFTAYQHNLLILITAVLRSNHVISKEQSFYILKYFIRQFGTKNGKALYQKLKVLIHQNVDMYPAIQFMASTTNRQGKIQVVTFLFGITYVDDLLLTKEKIILENIAKGIGLSQLDFERIIQKSQQRKNYKTQSKTYVSYSRHYEILGVEKNVNEGELKKAYRKLVLVYHPDRTKLDPKIAAQKFQEVQEAYDRIKEEKGFK